MGRKSKHYCAECSAWEPGGAWQANMSNRGTVVISTGTCAGTGRDVLNCHHACSFFERKKRTGFIYHGEGPITKRDIDNIVAGICEIIEDNKS